MNVRCTSFIAIYFAIYFSGLNQGGFGYGPETFACSCTTIKLAFLHGAITGKIWQVLHQEIQFQVLSFGP